MLGTHGIISPGPQGMPHRAWLDAPLDTTAPEGGQARHLAANDWAPRHSRAAFMMLSLVFHFLTWRGKFLQSHVACNGKIWSRDLSGFF